MFVAIPIGLACAVFLSEYASNSARKILKPMLELLAGIPTIVYGFALTVVTPLLQRIIRFTVFNAISPGIVIGFMMMPTIASLSEDAMRAVAKGTKEASLALGATRFEMVKQVVFPSAFTGIMAAIILALLVRLVKR